MPHGPFTPLVDGVDDAEAANVNVVYTALENTYTDTEVDALIPTALTDLDTTVTGAQLDSDHTKLAGIEALADVTDAANVGSSIHGATAKATPVDADTLPLIDSAASNALKKVTWANVKATAKSYFDTLYAAVSHTHPLPEYQWKSGTWHNSADAVRATGTGTAAQSTNGLSWAPVLVTEACTIDRLAIEVTTGGAGDVRLGLFSFDGNATMTLIVDGGTTSVASTGIKTVTISQALQPGCYWVGMFTGVNFTIKTATGAAGVGVGFVNATDITASIASFFKSGQTYGSFAASYSTITSWTGVAGIFAVRKA